MIIDMKYSRKIVAIHKLIKHDIEKRLELFEEIWKRGDDTEFFYELAFCLFTPQSSAFRSQEAIDALKKDDLVFRAGFGELSEILRIVRFRNNKARYLISARERFLREKPGSLRGELLNINEDRRRRDWLVTNVKGYGLKEASHFLRNVGQGADLAILDRHVLRNMVRLKLIDGIPASISRSRYIELENVLRGYAERSGIPLAHLDFVLWYHETGKIFK